MAIPGFFRQNKPRGFKYVPRYYDPQKEEWDQKRMARSMQHVDERSEEIPQSGRKESPGHADGPPDGVEAVRQNVSSENKPYRSKIMRGSMKNYFPRKKERSQRQSMIRFVVILIILAFVLYIYLRY
jgi:hypothetical protein